MFYYGTKLNNQKYVTMQPYRSGKVRGNSLTIVWGIFFRYYESYASLPDLLSDGKSFKLTAPPYNSVTAYCVSFEIVSITQKRINELIFEVRGVSLHSIL